MREDKKMKKIIYYICIAVLLVSMATPVASQKQAVIFEEQIPVKIQRLRQIDDSVHLVMDLDLKDLSIGTDRSLVLIPTLKDNSGHEYPMDNIMVNGRQRHKAFMREVKLHGWEKDIEKSHYAVLELKKSKKVFRYRQTIPYESWMREARLDVVTDLCGCAGHVQQLGSEKVAERIIMQDAKVYRPLANVAYIHPEVEAVKQRSESNNVFLDFPVARTEINPGFGNNPRELAKIENIIRELRGDKNLRVTGAMITGYASPEGDVNFNNQLSRGRAEALRNYLSMRAGIPPQLYQVGYGGEDWQGLARLVQNSYIEPKGMILGIIHNTNGEMRKQQLKMLGGGSVYQRMLHGLYPQLRRVVARIDYTVRGFNLEEARQLIKTRPRQLSLNEMFLVANSYPKGSKEFQEVFEIAVRTFPDDPVANLNAAASALLERDIPRAERYLQKAKKNTPEYYNNLGVLEMMRNNNARARNLFKRAADENLDEAFKNQEELKKKEAGEAQFKN